MNFLTFWLQFPLSYVNVCNPCHPTVGQYFEHMPNETEKNLCHMAIKLWGLCQAKGGMATVIMNDRVDSAFPKPSQMNENLRSFVSGRNTCIDVCWVFLFPCSACHAMLV